MINCNSHAICFLIRCFCFYLKLVCLIFAIIFSTNLSSDVSKYLKKIDVKDDIHSIKNVDYIYLINLDKRKDRLNKSMSQLQFYGIYPHRFSAVNGYSFSLEELNDMGLKLSSGMKTGDMGMYYLLNQEKGITYAEYERMNEFGKTYFNVHHGGIGCILSHLSILQDAIDSNYETIWIMEDDIEVLQDPKILSDLIDKLDNKIGKENWDILYTDFDRRLSDGGYLTVLSAPFCERPNYPINNHERFRLRNIIDDNFIQIGARWGTHSMIVRRSGMEKILNFIKELGIFLPIDLDIYSIEDIHLYAVRKNIVSNTLDSISDAFNAWDLFKAER